MMDVPMLAVVRLLEDLRDIIDVRDICRHALHDGRVYGTLLMMITTSDHMLHDTLTLANVS